MNETVRTMFRKHLSNPKVVRYSPRIAMGVKLLVSALVVSIGLFLRFKKIDSDFFFGTIIFYPLVGVVIDAFLYFKRDKIWQGIDRLPKNLKKKWQMDATQLLDFAKKIPLVRIVRAGIAWICTIITVLWSSSPWEMVFIGLYLFYFPGVLLDRLIAKHILKIKLPFVVYKGSGLSFPDSSKNHWDASTRSYDPYCPGSISWYSRLNGWR